MKEIHSNINIIGGGLIGAASAISLSKLGYKITVLEKNPAFSPKKKYKDNRTVAISEGTKFFFDRLDLWKEIKNFSQPIKKISVIDRNTSNILEFDNERRTSNLGYIVKNTDLLNVLYNKINKQKNIEIFNKSIIDGFEIKDNLIKTNLNNLSVISSLNIAADGKNSFVRKKYKTPIFFKNYKKTAFVVTFTHSKNHESSAFEFFYKSGPLAILPMKRLNNNFQSSIVWTYQNNYLKELMKMDEQKIISILNAKTQLCVGNIIKINSKQIFPLTAHLNTKFSEEKTIYVGDAAHSFHPIAGQGWNLGMDDVDSLTKLIKNYNLLGLEPGESSFCSEYHRMNYFKAYRLYQITDKLDKIFRVQNPLISYGRIFGLNLIQKNKKIKNIISDFAMNVN